MTPKRPKKPAAAGPQPEREKPLPRVWNLIFYSEEEIHFITLAIGVLQMGIHDRSDHPLDVITRMELQQIGLEGAMKLIEKNGRDWVDGIRKRFTDLVRTIEDEKKGGAHAP